MTTALEFYTLCPIAPAVGLVKAEAQMKQVISNKHFKGSHPDAETLGYYRTTLESFGGDFEAAGPAIDRRYRYAESLYAAGLLERRIIPFLDSRGNACGNKIEFRSYQP